MKIIINICSFLFKFLLTFARVILVEATVIYTSEQLQCTPALEMQLRCHITLASIMLLARNEHHLMKTQADWHYLLPYNYNCKEKASKPLKGFLHELLIEIINTTTIVTCQSIIITHSQSVLKKLCALLHLIILYLIIEGLGWGFLMEAHQKWNCFSEKIYIYKFILYEMVMMCIGIQQI